MLSRVAKVTHQTGTEQGDFRVRRDYVRHGADLYDRVVHEKRGRVVFFARSPGSGRTATMNAVDRAPINKTEERCGEKSEIPVGVLCPNQVSLPRLLETLHDHAGDRIPIRQSIHDEFFATHPAGQRWKLSENTVLALRGDHLLGEDGATPTVLAGELLQMVGTPQSLYERFSKNVLHELRGINLVETLITMRNAGEQINLLTIGKRLEQRGLHVPRGAVHLSSMRLWLAEAGVFMT